MGKICRQNVSFEPEKASLFPPSNHGPVWFLTVLLLSCVHLTFFPSDLVSAVFTCVADVPDLWNFDSLSLCLRVFLRFVFIAYVLFFFPSSVVLCTSTGDFRVLSSTTCWSTLLRPAWRFLTPLPVLLLVLEFAAIGSAAAVGPGSRNHRSRRFLLRFAGNLLVCYPWALTPTVY